MAGNKNSGRGSNHQSKTRLDVIEKAWLILKADLENPDLDLAIKRDIALKICPKTIPTELSGGFTADLQAMGTIEKVVGGVKTVLNFNIGTPVQDEPADTSPHT